MDKVELIASGLGWPEGPTVGDDGRIVFVESYRSQLSRWNDGEDVRPEAYVAGAPNSCLHGSAGELYVCQNGGTVGPWRAAEMTTAGIQRVDGDGTVRTIVSTIEGLTCNGPNDLVFGPDGHLYFTDPGTYNPDDPEPSRIFAIAPDGTARLVLEFETPTFPNGIVVEPDGSLVWDESYTGRLGRLRPDGTREDLGRLPGDNPIPDGMTLDSDGLIYVTDLVASGIHVLRPDGGTEGFIKCGGAPTNCVFDGSTLYVTDAGVLATSAEPSYVGQLWRVSTDVTGMPAFRGTIEVAS